MTEYRRHVSSGHASLDPIRVRVQSIMLAASGSETLNITQKLRLINRRQDHHYADTAQIAHHC